MQWELFKQNKSSIIDIRREQIPTIQVIKNNCSELYISTTTVILYLDSSINLRYIFPNIPIISFHQPKEGVIKKLMKYNFTSEQEADSIIQSFSNEDYSQIDLLKKNINRLKLHIK